MTDANVRLKYETGLVVGGYKLLSLASSNNGNAYWNVSCLKCQTTYKRRPAGLKQSNTKGCSECSDGTTTHGHATLYTPTYGSWCRMLQRARGTGGPSMRNNYDHVDVDQRWEVFENFLADMGERPAGTTIDRIDNSKGYHLSNCRWATRSEQTRNRRVTIQLTIGDVTKPLVDWADEWGLDYRLLRERYQRQGYRELSQLSQPARSWERKET